MVLGSLTVKLLTMSEEFEHMKLLVSYTFYEVSVQIQYFQSKFSILIEVY